MQFYDFGHGSLVVAIKSALGEPTLFPLSDLDRAAGRYTPECESFFAGTFRSFLYRSNAEGISPFIAPKSQGFFALQAGKGKGIILLKNEEESPAPGQGPDNILAVIGPIGYQYVCRRGIFQPFGQRAISILDGLRERGRGKQAP